MYYLHKYFTFSLFVSSLGSLYNRRCSENGTTIIEAGENKVYNPFFKELFCPSHQKKFIQSQMQLHPITLTHLLLTHLFLAQAHGWTTNSQDCVYIAETGPCFLNRSILTSQQLPSCMATADQPDVALHGLNNWFKITDFRRRELQNYVAHVLPQDNKPLQLVLDGSCNNKLDVVGQWIVVGGNVWRPWIDILNGTAINTVVMLMSFWSKMTSDLQHLTVQNIHRHLQDYGRFVLIGDGAVARTVHDFRSLLDFQEISNQSTFSVRQFALDGGSGANQESLKLHLGMSRVWKSTVVVSATKLSVSGIVSTTGTPKKKDCKNFVNLKKEKKHPCVQ